MADRFPCVECRKDVARTKNDRYRTHTTGDGEPCEMSSAPIPEHVLANGPVDGKTPADVPVEGVDYQTCPQCTRKVKLTRLGYFEPHDMTLRGGDRCPVSGVRAIHARKTEDVPLPGDEKPKPGAAEPKVKAQEEITSPAPTSTNAGAGSTPLAPPPTSGEGSEIDWSDVEKASRWARPDLHPAPADEGPASGPDSSAASGLIDWSKVGDLKHLSPEERVATLPDFSVEMRGELKGTPIGTETSGTSSKSPVPAPSADSSASTETSFPESPSMSRPSDDPPWGPDRDTFPGVEEVPADAAPFSLGVPLPGPFLQPFSPFSQPSEWIPPSLVFLQPPEYSGPGKPEPMGDLAKELATKIKETFYAYSNRKTTDNRSAQTTLGPSEIGTPCDRRLGMALLGVVPVNPGGDGWAAFVGTCTHVGMADVYTFADAGTGRYAVELPVFTGMPTVPRGTTDLLDRRDGTVVDWKVMGAYSLKKFKLEGPTATYRTQAHVYGYGAERSGEKVRNVAVVGLPRAGSSLDEMHVWTEKYDRKFAQAALERVENMARRVSVAQECVQIEADPPAARPLTPMEIAAQFDPADDCRYCPFHLKNDKEMKRGCPGK